MNYLKTLLDLYRLKRNTHISADRIRSRQDVKLRKLLRFAWANSCFPTIDKQVLLEHFDELVTVPDLKQDDLREFDAKEEADRRPYQGKYHVVHSSGSTGKPGCMQKQKTALPGNRSGRRCCVR